MDRKRASVRVGRSGECVGAGVAVLADVEVEVRLLEEIEEVVPFVRRVVGMTRSRGDVIEKLVVLTSSV